jgi:hypothetical protein
MHKDKFVSNWVVSITTLMGDACQEGFLIPLVALFYSEHSSRDILKRKRDSRVG